MTGVAVLLAATPFGWVYNTKRASRPLRARASCEHAIPLRRPSPLITPNPLFRTAEVNENIMTVYFPGGDRNTRVYIRVIPLFIINLSTCTQRYTPRAPGPSRRAFCSSVKKPPDRTTRRQQRTSVVCRSCFNQKGRN